MYVYIYIYIHTYIYACVYIYIYTWFLNFGLIYLFLLIIKVFFKFFLISFFTIQNLLQYGRGLLCSFPDVVTRGTLQPFLAEDCLVLGR